jgi:DNA polymerase III epsilon subunit-like protein
MTSTSKTTPDRIVFIDFETTGLNPFKDDIIEIAAIDNQGHSYQTLVKTDRKIPQESSVIHGITNEMVEKDGCDMVTALEQLMRFINGYKTMLTRASYLVGHNICNFDIQFLHSSLDKCNQKYNTKYELSKDVRILDTMRMSQCFTSNRVHNLGYLSKVYSIKLDKAHRAFADITATKELYDRIMSDYKMSTETAWKQTRLYGF